MIQTLKSKLDDLVKSQLSRADGLWKKLDICPAGNALGVRGVVSCTTIRQYIWYGKLSCKTENVVDWAFYESIKLRLRCRQIFLLGAILSFMVPISPSTADAYKLYSFKWPQPSTTFYVDIPGANGLWNDAFASAMSSWEVDTVFNFSPVLGVYEDPCDANDGRNGVAFGDTFCGVAWGATTLAITQSWYNSGSSTTIQTDIVFNSNKSWDVYSTAWQSPPWSGVNDFKRVAVHELGHVLSLDHEDSGIAAIMRSHAGDLIIPQQDDKNGVGVLYGFPVLDTDGDGLSDEQEGICGSDPADPSSTCSGRGSVVPVIMLLLGE